MTFAEFNAAESEVARAALLKCCGSNEWAREMLEQRPFRDREALLSTAEVVWWRLAANDWLDAFAAHPRIGEKRLSAWCLQEQSGIDAAQTEVLEQLARSNREYERRFGWIYLVNATGKSAAEMFNLLQVRLQNGSAEELRVAAGEQAAITRLRLGKLFEG